MIDFLRGLAPSADHKPSRAVAVLPSRFAVDRPLRAELSHLATPRPASEDETALPHSVADVRHARARQSREKRVANDSIEMTRERIEGVKERKPETAAEDRNRLDDRRRLSASAAARERGVSMDMPEPRVAAVRHEASREEPVIADASPRPAAKSHVESVRTVAPPSAPMSPARVAGRAASKHLPTEIYVTIDRIDVRVPGPAQRPPASPRATPAPTVSLSDYLRSGDTGRQGGGR